MMKLKEILEITQAFYEVVDAKTGKEIDENKYLENEVNNIVIVIDKKNNPYLSISVKVNN